MKLSTTTKVIVSTILVAALLLGPISPASAHHDDKAGKVHKDADGKITYINAGGIGDHVVVCPGGASATLFLDGMDSVQVIVGDPTAEYNPPIVDETIPIPGGPYGPIPLFDIPDQRVCLGGAASTTSDTTPPTIPDYWEVWAEDLTFQAVKSATGSTVDVVPAVFARMTAEATRSVTTADPASCVPPAPATRICQTTTVSETQFKVLTQFSVCGKAGVSGIGTNAFNDLISSKGSYDGYILKKVVFADGNLFFSLDCGLGGAALAPTYNSFVYWYNNDPSNPPSGLFSSLPNDVSTCNPGSPTGGSVCFSELPAGTSLCWNTKYSAGHTAALPGTIGTIGWSHGDTDNLNCHEPVGEGQWMTSESESSGIIIHNFPVTLVVDGQPVAMDIGKQRQQAYAKCMKDKGWSSWTPWLWAQAIFNPIDFTRDSKECTEKAVRMFPE